MMVGFSLYYVIILNQYYRLGCVPHIVLVINFMIQNQQEISGPKKSIRSSSRVGDGKQQRAGTNDGARGVEEMVWVSKIVDGEYVLSMKQWEDEDEEKSREVGEEAEDRGESEAVEPDVVKDQKEREVTNNSEGNKIKQQEQQGTLQRDEKSKGQDNGEGLDAQQKKSSTDQQVREEANQTAKEQQVQKQVQEQVQEQTVEQKQEEQEKIQEGEQNVQEQERENKLVTQEIQKEEVLDKVLLSVEESQPSGEKQALNQQIIKLWVSRIVNHQYQLTIADSAREPQQERKEEIKQEQKIEDISVKHKQIKDEEANDKQVKDEQPKDNRQSPKEMKSSHKQNEEQEQVKPEETQLHNNQQIEQNTTPNIEQDTNPPIAQIQSQAPPPKQHTVESNKQPDSEQIKKDLNQVEQQQVPQETQAPSAQAAPIPKQASLKQSQEFKSESQLKPQREKTESIRNSEDERENKQGRSSNAPNSVIDKLIGQNHNPRQFKQAPALQQKPQQQESNHDNSVIQQDNPPVESQSSENQAPQPIPGDTALSTPKSPLEPNPPTKPLTSVPNKEVPEVRKVKCIDDKVDDLISQEQKQIVVVQKQHNEVPKSINTIKQPDVVKASVACVVQVQTNHRQRLSIQRQVVTLRINNQPDNLQLQLQGIPYVQGADTQQRSFEQKDELRNQIDILKHTINELTKSRPARRSVRKESSGDIRSKKIQLKVIQKVEPIEKPIEKPKQQRDYEGQFSPTKDYEENELVMKIKRKQAEFQKFIKSTKLSRLQLHKSSKTNQKLDGNFTENVYMSNSSGKVDLALDLPQDYRLIEMKQSLGIEPEKYKELDFSRTATSVKQKVALLPEPPTFQMKSKQLTILGKAAFNIFNVEITEDEVLKINKYRNCTYFGIGDSHILWHYSGQFYIGDWKIKEEGQGCKQGYGIQYIPEKYIYEGEFYNGKREGKGRMETFMNEVYEGNWKDGKKEGFGKLIDSFGKVTHGKWSNGRRTDTNENTEGAQDQFKKEEFPNGDGYEGNYVNEKFEGQGKYTWKDGSFYVGEFVNGLRHGYGVWRSSEVGGDTYEGNYKDDKKSGRGKYTWANGTVYIGNFQKDLKHGEGQLKFLDGRTVNMNSFNGIPLNYHNKSSNNTPKQKRSLDTGRGNQTPRRHEGSAVKWSLKKINQNRQFCRSVTKNRKKE